MTRAGLPQKPADVTHGSDCAPCDATRAVVRRLRDEWDPLSNWDEVDVPIGPDRPFDPDLDGEDDVRERVSMTEWATRLVAEVLHRYPIPAAGS